MPMMWIDQEQAELIDAAVEMYHAALAARARRVDPEKIISNSLILQTHKLATVRAHLKAGAPRPWDQLPEVYKTKAIHAMTMLVEAVPGADENAAWEALRVLCLGPDLPPAA